MRHSWPRRTPMKLISEGPPSYRGSASSCCTTTRSACRRHRPDGYVARQPVTGNSSIAAVLVVLAVAIGSRLAWQLLAPLVPLLLVGLTLYAIYAMIFRRHK